MSSFKVTSPASAAPILVREGPTDIGEFLLTNLKGTIRYLKLWDAAAAADVTVGTTAPDVVIPVPPATAAPFFASGEVCGRFKLGLVIVVVTGLADNDATAPTARDVVGTLEYGTPGEC